jgi:hypothetical protein
VRGLAAPKVTSASTMPTPATTQPGPAAGAPPAAGPADSAQTAAGLGEPPVPTPADAGGTTPPPAVAPSPPVPPAAPSEAESIERLTISAWEQEDIQRLSALFRTPRTVKRFLNTYRFLRASLPPTVRANFVGTQADPGDYRVVIVLLAVVVSYSNIAPLFLQRLLDYGDGAAHRTWRAFIESVQPKPARSRRTARPVVAKVASARKGPATAASTSAAPIDAPPPSWEDAEWRQLSAALAELGVGPNANGAPFPPPALDTYVQWVPRVARYSFSLSALLTLRG